MAQEFFTRTQNHRWAFEPALGLVVAVAGGVAALVTGAPSSPAVVALFAAAVAMARFAPPAALAVGAVATVAGADVLEQPASMTLLFACGCLVAWTACLFGGPVVRYVALAVALVIGLLLTGLSVLPMSAPFGPGLESVTRFFLDLGSRLAIGFLATVVLAGGWAGAILLRQRADRTASGQAGPAGGAPSGLHAAETWLMSASAPDFPIEPGLFIGRPGFRTVSRRTLGIDASIAGAFFVFALVVDSQGGLGGLVVLVGFTAALVVRRLSPGLALTIAWITALAQMLGGLTVLSSNLAVLAVLYVTSAYAERVVRWAGLVSVGVGALLAAAYLTVGQQASASISEIVAQGGSVAGLVWSFVATFVATVAVLGLSWTLGLLMRTWKTARDSRLNQHRAVEEQRVAQRTVVVEQERNRIARDMHDVVAHSLAVVIAQADGARYARAQNPEAVDEALTTISTTARDALGDVRILLTRLRQDIADGPQPVLADLDRLVAQMRGTGLDIEWTTTGSPTTLGSGAQLAVYRIVQEALTNALRHGDAGRAVYLSLAWTDGWVAVTIDNAVSTRAAADASGELGHGLPGMRERALLAGGSLTAESIGGRFIVAAKLPAITTSTLVRPVAVPQPTAATRGAESAEGAQS
jgi:signal transduction histidine kinase